jgi:quercetin dioxygenase-like cupin family protein
MTKQQARQLIVTFLRVVFFMVAACAPAHVTEAAQDQYIIKATPGDTGVRMAVIEQVTEPGMGPPWHVHSREDEVFYVVEGKVMFWRGAETFVKDAGAVVVLPRGIPHTFKNVGTTRSRVLFTLLPDGLEKYFEIRNKFNLTPAEIDALAKQFGLTYLGPAPPPQKEP